MNDPEESPLVRHVLYTNEVAALLSAFVGALMFRAKPERIKEALERMLDNWDQRVARAKEMAESVAKHSGEHSGWEDDDGGAN